MAPPLDQEALLHEILDGPWQGLMPLPDTQIIERPGWRQIITPSLHQGGLNEVALCQLDEDVIEGAIDEVLRQYRGSRFRWPVTPLCRPDDLAQRLLHRGLRVHEVCGMYRSPLPQRPRLPAPVGCEIERVGPGSVDQYTATMAQGWGMDGGPLVDYHRRIVADPSGRAPLLLCRAQGEPAGIAGMVLLPGSALLLGAVVLPRFRGRGIYRALCDRRLQLAAEAGHKVATVWAMADTSAPLLSRMGFRTACRFPTFVGEGSAP